MAITAIICLFPLYVMIVSSLQSQDQVFAIPANFVPNPVRFDNYIQVWSSMPLARYIVNGLIVSLGSIVLTLVVAVLAAFPLAKLEIPGKKAIMTGLLFTQMFAPPVVLLSLFRIFRKLHLLDTLAGLIIVNTAFSLAFTTLLITDFFEMIPYEILEAATIDGCSKMNLLTKILLPVSSPGLVVTSIYVFTQVWNEFLFAFTFISSNEKFTPIVGLFRFIQVPGVQLPQWHLAMAASVIISIPALILFYLQRGSLSKGLTGGAIK